MEVIVAKTAGFCFGVKRAVEKVYEQIGKTEKPIYTYGPIIHNEEVVKDLRKKGVEVIDSLEELKAARDCVVVIRSHGVGKDVYRILEETGAEIVDATCPCEKDPQDRGGAEQSRKTGLNRRRCGPPGGSGNPRMGRFRDKSHRK